MMNSARNGEHVSCLQDEDGLSLQDEDGFFTCAVSVQHKKHDAESGSNYSGDESGRRVVWPANQTRVLNQTLESNKTYQSTLKRGTEATESNPRLNTRPGDEEVKQGFNRISRSNSRSKTFMDRARSFERGGFESRGNSRPVSRNGSFRNRSPSGNRSHVDEMWTNQIERPGSRTDVDSRRFAEIGRVNTLDWEERIHGSIENIPSKTPPPRRREMNFNKSQVEEERMMSTKTPEPPPPPVRANLSTKDENFPPPPSSSDTRSKLSEESVNQLSEENKEKIVKQWVESTSQSTEGIHRELERFAYDIAESVVKNMEKNSDIKEEWNQETQTSQLHQNQLVQQFWERQKSIPGLETFVANSNTDKTNIKVENKSRQSGGIFHAVPAHTSQQLHGPVYIQDQTRRGTTGMTFQQEERRRQELRKQEEAKQEEFRRQQEIQESQRFEELQRQEEFRLLEEKRRQEEMRRQEAMRRQEEGERKRQEEMRRQEEEERKRQEDLRRREEEQRRRQEEESRRRQEEKRRIEEERARQDAERRRIEELRKKEAEEIEFRRQEEIKRQEILRYEALKMEEEAKRQEEMRLEQEMRRKYEMQQQAIYEKQQLMEQQRIEQEQLLQQQQNQESIKVRAHIPKLSKNKSIDRSQDRINEALRGGEHLGKVKTGQVNEKRNFWIRSTSADRMGSQTLSPAPRRRRMDGWNTKQKENEDPESRPGSSLGAPGTGSVKNITSGFLSKSKSSAAVMQEEERGRPRHRAIPANSWTKEKYDEQTNQTFLKSQEVKTNKVNETITSWGKQDQTTSGRTTPVPSRHIGQVFAENKVAKIENEKSANSWRTKTPEPSVKLVNVCVEKGLGSTQNIHISSNAHSQMSNLMQESKVQSFTQKQEMVTSSSMATSSMSSSYSAGSGSQPPPTPERNQSFGGKCPDTKPELEPKRDPKPCHETKRSHLVPRDGNETKPKPNQESSVKSYSNKFSTLESSVSRQDMVQNYLQSSTSTQSINSVLSNCSSGAIPLPVKNSWFDDLENISVSSSFSNMQSLQSPVQETPVPVTAHWFKNSDLENKKQTYQVPSTNNTVPQTQDPVPQANNPAHQAHNSAPQTPNLAFHAHNSAPQPHNSAPHVHSPAPKAHNSASHVHNPAPQAHNSAIQVQNPAPKAHNPAPQTHNPAPQGQAKVFIKSVCSSEDLKIPYIEDFDNKSVRSDTTVIENRVSERTIIKPENPTTPQQNKDLTSVISVPQSPSEIRKKFQQNSSFEKSFQKSAEFELSKEFREGVRGKVKESRESFLKRSNSDKFEQTKEMRELELQAVKLHRSDSRNFEHSSLDKSEILRQEKLQELEDVKRSRSRSRMRDEENGENSYNHTKMEREAELLSLYNRRIEAVEDECLFSPTELKEIQLREERERELTELLNRQTLQEPEYTSAQKEKQMKIDRNLELIALTDRYSELDPQPISREEILRQERAEELRQISLLRNINSNEEDTRERGQATKTPELEVSEDTRGRVKETAAVWQHRDKREKSGSEDRFTPTPSRRIGSMFRREPEYWGEDEDLPAPPPEDVSNPPPPPRQSSRGKVEEYRTWSGGWKGRGSSSPAHPKLH